MVGYKVVFVFCPPVCLPTLSPPLLTLESGVRQATVLQCEACKKNFLKRLGSIMELSNKCNTYKMEFVPSVLVNYYVPETHNMFQLIIKALIVRKYH
jgi:hypothetical protein